MRWNDRELAKLGESTKPEMEGVLYHMKPQGNDWSDWYQQPSFKERYFKLIANLLFYYRVNEQEPLGVLVLENAQITYERSHKGIPFAFSIIFKLNDNRLRDSDSKHVFSCRCDEDVNKWVSALKRHSYEYWRSQYIILRTKISMKTGQDPILDYMKSKYSGNSSESSREVVVEVSKKTRMKQTKKSTFHSHIQTTSSTSTFYESESSFSAETKVIKKPETTEVNLIEL